MSRVCIEYECEVPQSQRRPANLLDALERGDRCPGEEEEGAVGEEKVTALTEGRDGVIKRYQYHFLI